MRLGVKYSIPLTGYLMFCLDDKTLDEVAFSASVDGFDVQIKPRIDKRCSQKKETDKYPTYGANELSVIVTQDSDGDESTIDWHTIEKYEYIAETAINRLLRYFQYRLNTPLLRLANAHDDSWSSSPILINRDENDKTFSRRISCADYSRHLAYGYYPRFSIKALCDISDDGLLTTLDQDIQPSLHEEFLCSARTEIIAGNIRRAVLEMAICCEVLVKSSLFSKSLVSSAIFDYLSRKRRIEISVHELLDHPVKEVWGVSFKDECLQDWKNIGYLFNARNRVAHTGICEYRNDKGNRFDVDEILVEDWWASIESLLAWLNGKLSK